MKRLPYIVLGMTITIAVVIGALFLSFQTGEAQTASYGTVVVNVSFLNVRGGPGVQYQVTGVVKGGSELRVLGRSSDGGWWKVENPFGSGSDAFVFADYVLYRGDATGVPNAGASSSAAPELPTAIVLAQSLNVRSGPSINFPSLGVVPQSFVLSVTGRHAYTGFLQVVSPFGVGWVANGEVALAGDTSLIPNVDDQGGGGLTTATTTGSGATGLNVVTTSTGTTFAPTGYSAGGTVRTDALPAYDRPEFGATQVGGYGRGDTVNIVGRTADAEWLAVNSPSFGYGWVRSSGVATGFDIFTIPLVNLNPQTSLEGKPTVDNGAIITTGAGPAARTITSPVAVYVRPSAFAPTIGSLGAAVQFTVIGRDYNIEFFQVPTPFGVGWVKSGQVRLINGDQFAVPITAVNGVPVGGQTTTGTTSSGTTTTSGGVVTSSSSAAGPVVVVNTSALNVRSGAGPNYSILGVVNGGTQMTVTGRTSFGWWQVVSPFGTGYVDGSFVVFRGDSSGVPVVSATGN